MRTLPVLLIALAAACCNGKVFSNYETLEVPVAQEFYRPGKKWNSAVPGPTQPAGPGVPIATHDGLQKVSVENKRELEGSLSVPVIQWIGGSLGLGSNEKVTVEFTGLRHTVIEDARPVNTTDAVLWETIAAEKLALTVTENAAARLSLTADLLERKLEATGVEGGPVNVNVTASGGRTYRVESDRPLVVAIRVVSLKRHVEQTTAALDLTTQAVAEGRRVAAAFGYEVEPRPPHDPLTRSVRLRIRNARVPGAGWSATHDFSLERDTWINTEREVIAADDDRAAKADYVWDSMNIEWKSDLSQCVLHLDRQYVTLERAESGLRGSR